MTETITTSKMKAVNDGLFVVLFSDTHGAHEDVKLPDGDVLVFAGDCHCVSSFVQFRVAI